MINFLQLWELACWKWWNIFASTSSWLLQKSGTSSVVVFVKHQHSSFEATKIFFPGTSCALHVSDFHWSTIKFISYFLLLEERNDLDWFCLNDGLYDQSCNTSSTAFCKYWSNTTLILGESLPKLRAVINSRFANWANVNPDVFAFWHCHSINVYCCI